MQVQDYWLILAFFVLVPMAIELFRAAGLPRRLMPAAVALGTTLAETFTTLSTTRHCLRLEFSCGRKNETDGGQVFVPKRGVPRATCGMSARQ
mgnify:CR=1 FL=1